MTEHSETHCQKCGDEYMKIPKLPLILNGTKGNPETLNYYYSNSSDDELCYVNSNFHFDKSMFRSIEKLDYTHFCEFCLYDLMKEGKIFYYGTHSYEVYFDKLDRKFWTKECSDAEPLANAILGKSG